MSQGQRDRSAEFLGPKKKKQPTSALCRVIGKPSFTDLFSSLGTVNHRLESESVKWSAMRQLFHKILPTY